MKIYNSLSRQKEEFIPIKKGKIGIYVCGPTVYDEPHIGHARSAYIFDCIRRYFEYKKFKVRFVRNVTDIDDKIIDKARKENLSTEEVSKKYLDIYHKDMALLGIAKPDREPKATEYIPKMIKFIGQLIERGRAYEADGDVYFDIKLTKDYGKLSNQNLEKMEVGARVAPGEKKKDPLDFVLWKKAKEGEPSWDSPWGRGRPGWHIECSVMSSDILGDEFDIHGGGVDLIFPHHENEIAQSEGADKKFARFWLHNGLLTIKGEKMAKSLGNFITIKDFLNKYKDADYLKLLFLNAHYRHPVDYSDEKIEEMKKQKKIFDNFFDKVISWLLTKPGRKETEATDEDKTAIENMCIEFQDAMDDNFNTPQALAVLFKIADLSSNFISADKKGAFNAIKIRMEQFLKIFGLKAKQSQALPKEIIEKVIEREKAREDKSFQKADAIRKEIETTFNGVLADTNSGITFIRE